MELVLHVLLVHILVQQLLLAQVRVLAQPLLMLLTPLPLLLLLLWPTGMLQLRVLLQLPRAQPSLLPWQCWDAAGAAPQVAVVRARSRP